MSDVVISVENLGKKYQLGHTSGERYTALRDVLAAKAKAPLQWLRGQRDSKRGTSTEEFWALKNVSFEVKRGDVVGIIGRNGAGKSTLLKILSRITEPTEGRVKIKGRLASLLEVGTGFHPELSGRENIFLNGAILGMSKVEIKSKFDEIVAFAEVEKFLDTPVKRYSSGMYVRLAFAVAAHLEPEIMVVDEVLAVGDAQFQKKCLSKMGDVAKNEGRTVIFVSHNIDAVKALCRTGILLRNGAVASIGQIDRVLSLYLSDAEPMKSGEIDLHEVETAGKRKLKLIQKMSLSSGRAGNPSFRARGDLIVDIHFDIKEPITEPRLALSIETHLGTRLFTVASYFSPGTLGTMSGRSRARCIIPELGLAPGTYLVSVSIADKYAGLLDSLDSVARFEVEWDNGFGGGEPFHSVYGHVLKDSTWCLTHDSRV